MTAQEAYTEGMSTSVDAHPAAGPMDMKPQSVVFTAAVGVEPGVKEAEFLVDPMFGVSVDVHPPGNVINRLAALKRLHQLGRAVPCLGNLAVDPDSGVAAFDDDPILSLQYDYLVDPHGDDEGSRLVEVTAMNQKGIDAYQNAVVAHLSPPANPTQL